VIHAVDQPTQRWGGGPIGKWNYRGYMQKGALSVIMLDLI
jgi:hypothetical protein